MPRRSYVKAGKDIVARVNYLCWVLGLEDVEFIGWTEDPDAPLIEVKDKIVDVAGRTGRLIHVSLRALGCLDLKDELRAAYCAAVLKDGDRS